MIAKICLQDIFMVMTFRFDPVKISCVSACKNYMMMWVTYTNPSLMALETASVAECTCSLS